MLPRHQGTKASELLWGQLHVGELCLSKENALDLWGGTQKKALGVLAEETGALCAVSMCMHSL